MVEIPELTAGRFERAIPASLGARLLRGDFRSGDDVAHPHREEIERQVRDNEAS